LTDETVIEDIDKDRIFRLLPLINEAINISFTGTFRSRMEMRFGPSPGFGSGLAGAEAYSL
jgi:hypothetical protein